jgi:cbb3-type cytochrome oxidase cytochrome c subunit
MTQGSLEKHIRFLIIFFMIALSISGLTAIPLVWEIGLLHKFLGLGTWFANLGLPWPYG